MDEFSWSFQQQTNSFSKMSSKLDYLAKYTGQKTKKKKTKKNNNTNTGRLTIVDDTFTVQPNIKDSESSEEGLF